MKKAIPPTGGGSPKGGGGAKKQIPPAKGGGPKKTLPPKKNPLPVMRHAALGLLLCIGLAAGLDPGSPPLVADQQTGEGWGALAGVVLTLGLAVLAGVWRLARARGTDPTPPPPVPDPWPSPRHAPNARTAGVQTGRRI